MRIEITSHENLARLLAELGFAPDMRCGGNGRCGSCRVKLLSGSWMCSGKPVSVPATVPACRTRLTGISGEVEFSFPAGKPAVNRGWRRFSLPEHHDPVAAFDLGTTTLAAVKLADGRVTAAGCLNPQNRFGDNVVSRIARASSPRGMAELRKVLIDSLFELADSLDLSEARRIAVSGNTVMTSILHGVSPSPLGEYPFTPTRRIFPMREDLLPPFQVFTVPCVSGYLGGDVTAGLYASKLSPGDMLIDLGTNCEIVFNTGGGWFGTSAAAGPAFEGVGLRSGSRAVSGAVDHYFSPGAFSTVDGVAPSTGVCGSAYVDYLAVERAAGRINEFGRFVFPEEPMREIAPGMTVGEDDVEQLLKAKAAIRSGISALERHCGAAAKRLILAGGFADGLDTDNAVAIGMLPAGREVAKIGNSSLAGAAALAADPGIFEEMRRLSSMPRELPLAELPGFEGLFIDALLLP